MLNGGGAVLAALPTEPAISVLAPAPVTTASPTAFLPLAKDPFIFLC